MNLKNAVALITGGSSGIGRAVAQSLAASGARVAITGRDQRRLTETARELGVHAIHADVSVEADVERTYREVLQQFGDLDILVNNAGSGVFKNLVDFERKEFEAVFATNVLGAMLMAREAARHFVKRQRGNIVNIASTAASARGPERHGVLWQQVRPSRHDGVLASGTPAAQRPGFSGQPQRSADQFLSDGRLASKRKCHQTPRGRDCLHGEIDSGDGRPRLYARGIHFCNEPERLKIRWCVVAPTLAGDFAACSEQKNRQRDAGATKRLHSAT